MPETTSHLKIVTHDQFCMERIPDPCGIVIFGASGDLAHRKLIPALYRLFSAKLFPKGFFIIGFGRTPWDDRQFRKEVLKTLGESSGSDGAAQKDFSEHFCYQRGDYDDLQSLNALREKINHCHDRHKTKQSLLFYLATPPALYGELTKKLAEVKLIYPRTSSETPPALYGELAKKLAEVKLIYPRTSSASAPWTRFVFEKPFGSDFNSALELNRTIKEVLSEDQIYRIDHYLGKETVQNVLIFRFTNAIFEPIWNRRYIDHVQITASETLGVEKRAGYYDQAGALRDMFQNHMFQLLSLVAMEPPVNFNAAEYRDEKVKVIRALRPIPPDRFNDWVARGQYGAGEIESKKVPAYHAEKGVSKKSVTETFVAMKLLIDNWRWQGVPFYLRSGKRLQRPSTEIAIQFKTIPHSMFASLGIDEFPPNVLVLRIQPNEGISISFEAKHPGPKFCMATLNLEFDYHEVFQKEPLGAYERLLLDAMLGDQTLFVREDMVEESWAFMTAVLNGWRNLPAPVFPNYAAGSQGPREADRLIKQDGRVWRAI